MVIGFVVANCSTFEAVVGVAADSVLGEGVVDIDVGGEPVVGVAVAVDGVAVEGTGA